MNQEALRAFHIAKANQDGPILRDVSLSVRRQCCVGIAGPNESGKSLLLRILAGQESFDSGYLAINGQAVAPQKAEARRDVMLIQRKQSLVKSLSVADNLLMNRPHASKPHLAWGRQLNRQAQGILEEFGLRFDPGAHVGDLTSGQCMQVELLRCHLLGAGIILIDDICREELHSELPAIAHLLRSMQRKGKTFVVTGILPEELWTFCDAVMSLRAGLCLRSGWARVGAHGEGARQPSPRAEAAPAPDTREAVFCAERLMLPSGASLSLTLRRGEIVGLVDAYVKHHMALLERLAHLPRDGALMRSLLPQPCPRRRRNRLPIAVIGRDSRSYVVENTSMFENAVLPSYPRLRTWAYSVPRRFRTSGTTSPPGAAWTCRKRRCRASAYPLTAAWRCCSTAPNCRVRRCCFSTRAIRSGTLPAASASTPICASWRRRHGRVHPPDGYVLPRPPRRALSLLLYRRDGGAWAIQ